MADMIRAVELLRTELMKRRISATKSRDEVCAALYFYGPCSMERLIDVLHGRVSHMTVYRTIKLFQRIGVVSWVRQDVLELQPPFRQHHHHFVCTKCGIRVDFYEEQLEAKIARMATQRGLTLSSHQIELTGLCSLCGVK